jgi:dTDP-glucose 4,6-dehydratase
MKLLVTGGAGFIGSAVCRHIISTLGWQVVVVDKLTYAGHLSSLSKISAATGYKFMRLIFATAKRSTRFSSSTHRTR